MARGLAGLAAAGCLAACGDRTPPPLWPEPPPPTLAEPIGEPHQAPAGGQEQGASSSGESSASTPEAEVREPEPGSQAPAPVSAPASNPAS